MASRNETQSIRLQTDLLSLLLAHFLDIQIPVDHAEHIQVLALVLMDTLDLDIVQGIGGNLNPSDFLQMCTVFFHIFTTHTYASCNRCLASVTDVIDCQTELSSIA